MPGHRRRRRRQRLCVVPGRGQVQLPSGGAGCPHFPVAPVAMQWAKWMVHVDATQLRPVDVIGRISPRPILITHGDARRDRPAAPRAHAVHSRRGAEGAVDRAGRAPRRRPRRAIRTATSSACRAFPALRRSVPPAPRAPSAEQLGVARGRQRHRRVLAEPAAQPTAEQTADRPPAERPARPATDRRSAARLA